MIYQIPQFWNIVFNGFQILLFLLIFCFFLNNRLSHKKLKESLSGKNINPNFEAAFVSITLQQVIYRAFKNILDTIATERIGLEKLLEYHADPRFDRQINSSPSNRQRLSDNAKQSGTDDNVELKIRENKIRKFSSKGLHPQEISETLKIPLNEVELILSLSKN